jgi:hypothetical protein
MSTYTYALFSLLFLSTFFFFFHSTQGGGKGLISSLLSCFSFIYVLLSFNSFSSSPHPLGSFIGRLIRLIPLGIAASVSWLLHYTCACIFLHHVFRWFPRVGSVYVKVLRSGFFEAISTFL